MLVLRLRRCAADVPLATEFALIVHLPYGGCRKSSVKLIVAHLGPTVVVEVFTKNPHSEQCTEEGKGFEPLVVLPTSVFKTDAFVRSANLPKLAWQESNPHSVVNSHSSCR